MPKGRRATREIPEDMLEVFLLNPRWWLRRMNVHLELQGRKLVAEDDESKEALTLAWNRVRKEVPCACEIYKNGCAVCREFGFEPGDHSRLRVELKMAPLSSVSAHHDVRYMGPGKAHEALSALKKPFGFTNPSQLNGVHSTSSCSVQASLVTLSNLSH